MMREVGEGNLTINVTTSCYRRDPARKVRKSQKVAQSKLETRAIVSSYHPTPIAMKKSKFTEAQIVFALRQPRPAPRSPRSAALMGISEATFYNWKKKYGGLGSSELRRLRQLEAENQQPGRLVADLSLDKHMSYLMR